MRPVKRSFSLDKHLHTLEPLPKVFYLTGNHLMQKGLRCPDFRWMNSEERHETPPTSCESQIEGNCKFNTIVSES